MTYPTNGMMVTNPVITVTGTASRGVVRSGYPSGITNMQAWVQNWLGMNFQGEPMMMNSSGQPDSWSFEASLVGGYNTVGARATQGDGIFADGYARIYYKQLTSLTLSVSGAGKVTPNLNGRILETTVNYQMTAKPGSGYAFAGWTGDIMTNCSTLNFAMASNLVLQANFVPTPFTSAAGTYGGTIAAKGPTQDSANFKAKVSRDGTFTARIQLKCANYANVVNGNYALSGAFSADGSYSGSIRRKKSSSNWPVNLQLHLDINSHIISGTITDTYQNWTGYLAAPAAMP